MKNKHISMLMCASSAMVFSMVGQAQESGAARSILEEIVVTAERRAQNLQDVPLSISAFGSEKRDTIGILSIQDMADYAPGVSYTTSNDRPSIRGIGRQSNSFAIDSPVANYFDGVYTTSVQDAQRRPIFIDRTEILRGPQGALSGRGSIAGAINTWSKRPNEEFGGEVRGFAGNYARYGLEGTVTGSVTDWMRARINLASYHQEDGYFQNVATGKTEGDQPNNRQLMDLLFEIDFSENVDMFLTYSSVEYDETRRSGGTTAPYISDIQGLPANAYGYLGSPLTPSAAFGYFDPNGQTVGTYSNQNPVILTGDKRKFANNFQSSQKLDDHHKLVAHLNIRLDAFDLKWIGGHSNYKYTQQTDGDGTSVTSMTLPTGRVVNPSSVNTYMEDREWHSNEFTITSNSDGDFQWIAGIYVSGEDYIQQPFTLTHEDYDELATPIATTVDFFPPTAIPFPWPTPAVNQLGNTSVFGEEVGDTSTQAIFGQIDYQLSDAWKFTLGARYNKDEKKVTEQTRYVGNNFGYLAGDSLAGGATFFGPISLDATPAYDGSPLVDGVAADYGIDPVTGNRVRDLEGEWDATTGSLGVDFTPNDDTLLYARLASGYRAGGFNAGFIADLPKVENETVYSLEVGYKGTIADQLQISASAFYYDFRDQQLSLPALGRCTDPNDLSTCTIVANFFNVPESESKGFEIDSTWSPSENFSLTFTYSYLDSTIKDGLINGQGFQNPSDPAAVLPNANPITEIVGQVDQGYTNLNRQLQDISGNKTINAPEHKFAIFPVYTIPMSAGDLTMSAGITWRDESYSDVFETEAGIVEDYTTVDARLIWTDNEDRYTVILSGDNLTNEEAQDGGGLTRQATAASGAAGQVYYETFNLIAPRLVTLELQYRFGEY